MKLSAQGQKSASRRSGSAVLIVFILIAVMGALIVCNNRILHTLKAELRFVEQKQQRKFAPAASATNPPPTEVHPEVTRP